MAQGTAELGRREEQLQESGRRNGVDGRKERITNEVKTLLPPTSRGCNSILISFFSLSESRQSPLLTGCLLITAGSD